MMTALKETFYRIEWKLAVKTGIAAALGFFLSVALTTLLQRPDTLVSGVWCVLTAIVVLQANLGGTYQAALNRFLGVLTGSVMGGLFTSWLGSDPWSLALAIFSTVIICSIINIKDSVRIACLSTAVVMVLWGLKSNISPWLFSFYRLTDSTLGICIALFVAHVIWPERVVKNLQENIIKALGLISQLYRLSVKLDHGEENQGIADNLFMEIDDLMQKSRTCLDTLYLEFLTNRSSLEGWTLFVHEIENIFKAVYTLKKVDKTMLIKIFDDRLANQVALVIEKTDLSFQDLAKFIQSQKTPTHLTELDDALVVLDQEMLRFRGTHTIRKFNLEDVENFYVFFHNLRYVGEDVKKIESRIEQLIQ